MPDAHTIALKYKSPRYLRLERHEAYVDGTQYAGRPDFLATDDVAAPVLERAPCIVDPITEDAIGDLTDFMMGEGRYPYLTTSTGDGDDDLDDDQSLDKTQSELLEKWLNGHLTKSASMRFHLPEALKMSMKAGSVAVVASIREGMPCLEAIPAKWCTPSFDPRTKRVIRLEIKYPYIIDVPKPNEPGEWEQKCFVYRRVIDEVLDTVFLPGEGKETGLDPSWAVDVSQTAVHGLGFCPAVWYAFEKGAASAASFDGHAIHGKLHDEIDALNFSESQRHRAALYAGDPQIWETGVDATTDVGPTGRGQRPEIELQATADGKTKAGVFTSNPRRGRRGGGLRKKGPGVVWRYPEATSKVGMLTLGGDALDSIQMNSDAIRKMLTQAMSVVIVDPNQAKTFGALSGKAMAFLFARMVARADNIRLDAGDNLLLKCIDLLLRMCLTVERLKPGGLRIPGIKKILPILEQFEQDVQLEVVDPVTAQAATGKQWFGPRISLEWGPYFVASAEEENFLVTMCAQALTAGLMPLEVCIEKLRSVFTFASIEELIEMLDKAKQKAVDDAAANADALGAIGSKYATGQPDGPPFPPSKGGSANGAKGDKKA